MIQRCSVGGLLHGDSVYVARVPLCLQPLEQWMALIKTEVFRPVAIPKTAIGTLSRIQVTVKLLLVQAVMK